MSVLRRLACALAALAAFAAGASVAAADGFPSRPLRLIVPFAAGTQVDAVARTVAAPLAADLGQPVIVENRPGASGTIAADLVARAVPDGHTLLLAGVTQTIQPGIPGANAVDPTTAFAPVIKLSSQPMLLAAHHDFPVSRLADVVALARREPGRIAYSTAGVGSSGHLAAAMFTAAAQVDLLHVPYATTNAIWRDAVAGLVPLTFNPVSGALPHLGAGKLKPIAVTGSRRSRALPETPTFAEAGYPGVDIHSWYGILAPAGTPPETVARLHAALAGILRQPDVRARFTDFGLEIAGTPPGPMAAEIKAEVARWRPIIKALGLDATGEAGRPAPAR
jgi:tripartite-type tricarboxylate transporter receptor subunit TctC